MKEIKYCLHCGKKIQSDSVFCTYCGQKIEYDKMINQENKELKEKNTGAIVGFIFAFIPYFTFIGFVISLSSLISAKNYKEQRTGLAIAGVVISSIILIISAYIASIRLQHGESIWEIYGFENIG